MDRLDRLKITSFAMLLVVTGIAIGFTAGYDFGNRLDVRKGWQPVTLEEVDTIPTLPAYNIYSIDQVILNTELEKYQNCSVIYLDRTYYYTDKSTTSELIDLIYNSLPEYDTETWDCDDIALFLKVRMAYDYGLNCIGYTQGSHTERPHAWNIVLTNEGIFSYDLKLNKWVDETQYSSDFIQF